MRSRRLRWSTLSNTGLVATFVVSALGCAGAMDGQTETPAASDASTAEPSDESAPLAPPKDVRKELPAPLLGELRQEGSDLDGRLLTLGQGFIATAPCSDCGAPTYQWFLAVRCEDEHHCEVLTEHCEGQISRELDTYSLEFHAVEGVAAAGEDECAGYSGTFAR